MSTESPEFEQTCRALFESTRDRASHNLEITKGHAELSGPAARFLADYERIGALPGQEFCEAALDAVQRFDEETQAAYGGYRKQLADQIRESFEQIYGISVELLQAQSDFYSRTAQRGGAREPSPMGKRFRERATALLANADRIRALTGEDFIREAQAVLDPFTSIDMSAVKSELHADDVATRLRRRLRREPR